MYSVQCSETVIGMCTVYSGVSLLLMCLQRTVHLDCYWPMYSAQCIETLIGVCTVHSAVRLLLECVQCTVQ